MTKSRVATTIAAARTSSMMRVTPLRFTATLQPTSTP
jgi:hypothetical protein